MNAPRILLAGATGAVGVALLRLLNERGYPVRTLSRSKERAQGLTHLAEQVIVADATRRSALTGIADGVDIVVSCLGASVGMAPGDKRSFSDVDTVANTNLLAAALEARVKRFVYVAAHVEPGYEGTRYVRAHEAFVEMLRASGMPHTVVRPTGMFPAFRDLLRKASRGRVPVVGDGAARTNPVHPEDVAAQCLAVLEAGPTDASVGGPEVLRRLDIARAAFSAVGRPPQLMYVPAWALRGFGSVVRLWNPRLGEVLELASRVSVTEAVAPRVGTRRLEDYFRDEWQLEAKRRPPGRLTPGQA